MRDKYEFVANFIVQFRKKSSVVPPKMCGPTGYCKCFKNTTFCPDGTIILPVNSPAGELILNNLMLTFNDWNQMKDISNYSTLSLAFNQLTIFPMIPLNAYFAGSRLEFVDVSDNFILGLYKGQISLLGSLFMKSLNLSRNPLTIVSHGAFDWAPNLTELIMIDAGSKCKILQPGLQPNVSCTCASGSYTNDPRAPSYCG